MRTFVQPHRWHKRSITRTEAKKASERKIFLYYYRQRIIWIILGGIIVYIMFFYNRSPILQVKISQSTQSLLQYDAAFSAIQKSLVWIGYIKWRFLWQDDRLTTIKTSFPIIQNIAPSSFKNGILTIDVTFYQPDFLMKTEDNVSYLTYHNTIIPYTSGGTLWSTGLKVWIALPNKILQEFSWGIFRKLSSTEIAYSIQQITFLSGSFTTTYYPWREKWIIHNGNRSYIFSLDPKKLQDVFVGWKKILPYLPTATPTQLDLSSPHRIIIK